MSSEPCDGVDEFIVFNQAIAIDGEDIGFAFYLLRVMQGQCVDIVAHIACDLEAHNLYGFLLVAVHANARFKLAFGRERSRHVEGLVEFAHLNNAIKPIGELAIVLVAVGNEIPAAVAQV